MRIAIWIVVALGCVGSGLPAAEPKTWQIDLADGGRIVGVLVDPQVVVETEFGKLAVPVERLERITPGLSSRPATEKRVLVMIEQLGEPLFATREEAQGKLMDLRREAHGALVAARNDAHAERRARVRRILDDPKGAKESAVAPYWPRHDEVVAGEQQLVGRISPTTLGVRTKYGVLKLPVEKIGVVAPPPSSRAIDLLKEIEVDRDSVSGKWTREGDKLISPKANRARLQVPVDPPDEYKLTVVAKPIEGREFKGTPIADSLFVGIVVNGRACNVAINAFSDVKGGPFSGLDTIDGKRTHLRPLHTGTVLKLDEEVMIEVAVRKERVITTLDEKPLFTWRGDAETLDVSDQWRLRDGKRLGLGAHHTVFQIRRFDLTPISDPIPPTRVGDSQVLAQLADGSLVVGTIVEGTAAKETTRLRTSFGELDILTRELTKILPFRR